MISFCSLVDLKELHPLPRMNCHSNKAPVHVCDVYRHPYKASYQHLYVTPSLAACSVLPGESQH